MSLSRWVLPVMAMMLMLSACGQGANKYEVSDDSKEYPEAVKVYQQSQCLLCHSTDLQGRMGDPSNLTAVGSRLSKEQIYEVIHNGRDLMPAFADQLTEDEIQALADWLFTKKGSDGK